MKKSIFVLSLFALINTHFSFPALNIQQPLLRSDNERSSGCLKRCASFTSKCCNMTLNVIGVAGCVASFVVPSYLLMRYYLPSTPECSHPVSGNQVISMNSWRASNIQCGGNSVTFAGSKVGPYTYASQLQSALKAQMEYHHYDASNMCLEIISYADNSCPNNSPDVTCFNNMQWCSDHTDASGNTAQTPYNPDTPIRNRLRAKPELHPILNELNQTKMPWLKKKFQHKNKS